MIFITYIQETFLAASSYVFTPLEKKPRPRFLTGFTFNAFQYADKEDDVLLYYFGILGEYGKWILPL